MSDTSDEELKFDHEPLLEDKQKYIRKQRSSKRLLGALWILSLISTCVITYILVRSQNPLGSFAGGYRTDFEHATSSLRLTTKQFTGSPLFRSDGEEYVPEGSPSLRYMNAGADVDEAWNELTKDRYFLLTDAEAQQAWGDDYRTYWDELRGGYLAGLDMFHTLHCLNHIRMAFYPDIYPLSPIHGAMHQAHCIDHLRQMIMCNADLTPIPTKFYEGIGQNYINSDRTHTCRDFSAVREWASSRYNGSLAVKPRNIDGTTRDEFYSSAIKGGHGDHHHSR